MSRPCYQKDKFIIVQNQNKKKTYYTVINTNLINKPHTHLYTFKQAKLIIHWAIKGRVPNRYSHHMQESIKRLRPDLVFDEIVERTVEEPNNIITLLNIRREAKDIAEDYKFEFIS